MADLFGEIQKSAATCGKKSTLQKIFARLDEQDRNDLIKALDDISIPALAIRAALAKRNIALSMSAIYRYRKGEGDFELER
jgi:hypothetical protein